MGLHYSLISLQNIIIKRHEENSMYETNEIAGYVISYFKFAVLFLLYAHVSIACKLYVIGFEILHADTVSFLKGFHVAGSLQSIQFFFRSFMSCDSKHATGLCLYLTIYRSKFHSVFFLSRFSSNMLHTLGCLCVSHVPRVNLSKPFTLFFYHISIAVSHTINISALSLCIS